MQSLHSKKTGDLETIKKYLQDDTIITVSYSMPFGLMSQQAKICWSENESNRGPIAKTATETPQQRSTESFHTLKVGTSFLDSPQTLQTSYQTLWQKITQAQTLEQAAAYWLSLQCSLISGVTRGVIVLKTSENETFTPMSVWPKGQSANLGLTEATEICLQEKRGIVRDTGQKHADLKQSVSYVSYPLMIDDQIRGVVSIEILQLDESVGALQAENSMRAVMRQLQWGSAWLELFAHRQMAKKYTPEHQPFVSVLELIASTLAHEKLVEQHNKKLSIESLRQLYEQSQLFLDLQHV